MLTAGPMGSLGSAVRLLSRELPAGLVHGACGERVTMLLTAMVWSVSSSARGSADGAEAAGAARVVAVDVVEAVAER